MQILVGDFTEHDLKNGIDKIEVDKNNKEHLRLKENRERGIK